MIGLCPFEPKSHQERFTHSVTSVKFLHCFLNKVMGSILCWMQMKMNNAQVFAKGCVETKSWMKKSKYWCGKWLENYKKWSCDHTMQENLVPSSLSNKCPYYLNLLIKSLLLMSKLTLISFSIFKRLFFNYEKKSLWDTSVSINSRKLCTTLMCMLN